MVLQIVGTVLLDIFASSSAVTRQFAGDAMLSQCVSRILSPPFRPAGRAIVN